MIDWDRILKDENEGVDGPFADLGDLLHWFYWKLNIPVPVMSEYLDVSESSLYQKMKSLGIPIKPRGKEKTDLYPERFGYTNEKEMLFYLRYDSRLSYVEMSKLLSRKDIFASPSVLAGRMRTLEGRRK